MTKEDPADAHEERNMWNQIVNDLKRLKVLHARATEVSNAIVDMEAKFDGSQYSSPFVTLSHSSHAFFGLLNASPVHFPAARFEISRCSHLRSRFIWGYPA